MVQLCADFYFFICHCSCQFTQIDVVVLTVFFLYIK